MSARPRTDDPTWAAFVRGLDVVLRGLRPRMYLVITSSANPATVQFRMSEDLYAEARGDDFVPDDRHLSLDQVEQMRVAGWDAPTVDPAGMRNWHRILPWPATSSDYHQLVEACVLALRLRGVTGAAELTYKAWRDPEPLRPGVTYYDGDLEPGISHMDLPELGIPARG